MLVRYNCGDKIADEIDFETALRKLKANDYKVSTAFYGMSCIVTGDGKIVSNEYHEFRAYKGGDVIVLTGVLGSQKNLLKIPQKPSDFFDESPVGCQIIGFHDGLGLIIGVNGSEILVLDPQTGEIVGKTNYEIIKKNGKLYHEWNGILYEIKLSSPKTLKDDSRRTSYFFRDVVCIEDKKSSILAFLRNFFKAFK